MKHLIFIFIFFTEILGTREISICLDSLKSPFSRISDNIQQIFLRVVTHYTTIRLLCVNVCIYCGLSSSVNFITHVYDAKTAHNIIIVYCASVTLYIASKREYVIVEFDNMTEKIIYCP